MLELHILLQATLKHRMELFQSGYPFFNSRDVQFSGRDNKSDCGLVIGQCTILAICK